MSKAIGSVLGTNVKANTRADQNYVDYLKGLDTSYADTANQLLAQEGLSMAQNLNNLPSYQFSLNVSDEAAKRAEDAVYQSYTDKLDPLHRRQTQDLETKLANQGLSVGSEAYRRAMSDLQASQNDALNQAAYKSVAAGQDAYHQSFKEALDSGNFTNGARRNYVNDIYMLMQNSPSEYERQMNIYAAQNAMAARQAEAKQQSFNNTMGVAGNLLKAGALFYGA